MSATKETPGIHPAFPVDTKSRFIDSEWNGLSKREYIATQILNGLLSRGAARTPKLVPDAIAMADEMLKQIGESPL